MTKVPTTRTVMHRYVSSAIRKDGVLPMGAKEGFRDWLDEELAKAWDEGQKSGLETGVQIAENVHEHGGILEIGYLPQLEENPYRKAEK